MGEMDSDLLDLPLGVKIPVKPKSKPVLCRGRVGEKLHGPCPFNLDDPYLYQFSPSYNCLHDPHLRDYHRRKDIQRSLRRRGFITSDNKGRRLPPQAKVKYGPKVSGTTDTSCRAEQRLQPQKPCPHQQKSKEIPLKSGRFRRMKIAFNKDQTYCRAELGTAADTQRKLDNTADGPFKSVFEQLTEAETQKLQEMVETIVLKVFARLQVPQNQRVNFLRNTAQRIKGIAFGGCVKAEPAETLLHHHQKMEKVAKELLATVLESFGDRLESQSFEPRRAARRKEQPLHRGATRAEKSMEAEIASLHTARIHACLDNLTRHVVERVDCLLKSMIASQFPESSYEYTEILELPNGKVSNRCSQDSLEHLKNRTRKQAWD